MPVTAICFVVLAGYVNAYVFSHPEEKPNPIDDPRFLAFSLLLGGVPVAFKGLFVLPDEPQYIFTIGLLLYLTIGAVYFVMALIYRLCMMITKRCGDE